jgi:DNA-binding transcriptional MocR family regulator
MNILVRYRPQGGSAKEISASVEAGVRSGQLTPGDRLPPVRELADELGVSPTTVAAAYSDLRRRGITAGAGRAGTRVRGAPPVSSRVYLSAPPGTRDLITGGPDPDLLPPLPVRPAARPTRMYGQVPVLPRLRELAADQLAADGIDATSLMVTGGALDGIERVLATWLMPSDRVIVEDPGHAVTFDLVAAMGYTAVPVPVDELGIRPAELAAALAQGAGALIVTPRAQAATGAAWNQDRAAAIGTVLRRYPALGVIEDDHAGPVAGVPAFSAVGAGGRERWATIRSVSKSLGPDLRLAVMAGDEATIARVAGRQGLGTGWVSYQLQELVTDLWADPAVAVALRTAAGVYARRGDALRSALREHGITASGRSGFTSWVRVSDEDGVASSLVSAGWAVAPGQRFRIAAPPGVRISFASLEAADAASFAADFARALRHRAARLDLADAHGRKVTLGLWQRPGRQRRRACCACPRGGSCAGGPCSGPCRPARCPPSGCTCWVASHRRCRGRAAGWRGLTSGCRPTAQPRGMRCGRPGRAPRPSASKSPARAGTGGPAPPWPASPSWTGFPATRQSPTSGSTTPRGPSRRRGSAASCPASASGSPRWPRRGSPGAGGW